MSTELYECFKKSPYKSVKHSTYFKSYEHFLEKYRGKESEIGLTNSFRNRSGPQQVLIFKVIVVNFTTAERPYY